MTGLGVGLNLKKPAGVPLHPELVLFLRASLSWSGVLIAFIWWWATFGVAFAQSKPVAAETPLAEIDFGTEIRFFGRAASDPNDPVTAVQLLYRVDDSPVQNTGVPSFQPGPAVAAIYRWRVSGVLQPGTEVKYQFIFETKGGQKITTPEQAVTYNDTRFDWREARTGSVTAHWHSVDEAVGQTLLDEATRTVSRLDNEFGITPEKPLHVYGYVRTGDYTSAVASGGRNLDYATAAGSTRIYVLFAAPNTAEALLSLRREVARAVFEQKTANAYSPAPRWLALGFSRYVAGEDVSGDNQKVLTDFAQNNKLLSLKSLAGNLPTTGNDRALAYEQSLSAVKYLSTSYPPDKIRATFEAFREGNTVDDAFKRGLGNTLDQFETKWRNNLRLGLPQKPNTVNPTPRPGVAGSGSQPARPTGAASGVTDAGPEWLAVIDPLFGNSIEFWRGIFGASTRYVFIGVLGFMVVAVLAVVVGSVFGALRRARDDA